jgi:hypothetical protein
MPRIYSLDEFESSRMDIVGEQCIVPTCRKLDLFISQFPILLAADRTFRHTAWVISMKQACDRKCEAVSVTDVDFGSCGG